MIPAIPFCLCCMAFHIETKSDEFDERCLSCPPRADNNIQTRHELDIETIQETFLNLNTFNMHASRSQCMERRLIAREPAPHSRTGAAARNALLPARPD